jgi:hypothetical protein
MGTKSVATLPVWMLELQAPVDLVRRFLKRTPELSKLGTTFGPTKVYTRDEANQIIAAFWKHQEARKPKAPAL